MDLSRRLLAAFALMALFTAPAFAAEEDNWDKNPAATSAAATWAAPAAGDSDILPEIQKLRERMGEFLNQGMDELQKKGYTGGSTAEPRTDILEKEGAFFVLADLPGMRKDEINIEVNGQVIMISGDRKVTQEFKTSNLYKVERRYGSFKRAYTMPEEFMADQVSAKYENGVLEVRVPKKNNTPAPKPKTIAIS